MGKGDRARKRPKVTLPPCAPTPRPRARGWDRAAEIHEEETQGNLKARARLIGLDPGKPENLDAARAVHLGDEAGRLIHLFTSGEDRRMMVHILFQWQKSHDRFLKSVMDRSLWSGRDSIPDAPATFGTREDTDYDMRTPEERADAANKAWRIFCEDTKTLTIAQLQLCFRGVWDVQPVNFLRDHGGKPIATRDGLGFLAAFQAIIKMQDR